MLRERVQEWMAEKWAQGHAEGQAEGQVQGRMDLMRRQAARKFGDETAQRLAERLEPAPGVERLAEIGEWLIECESGEALLARLDRMSDSVPDGQKPEHRPPR